MNIDGKTIQDIENEYVDKIKNIKFKRNDNIAIDNLICSYKSCCEMLDLLFYNLTDEYMINCNALYIIDTINKHFNSIRVSIYDKTIEQYTLSILNSIGSLGQNYRLFIAGNKNKINYFLDLRKEVICKTYCLIKAILFLIKKSSNNEVFNLEFLYLNPKVFSNTSISFIYQINCIRYPSFNYCYIAAKCMFDNDTENTNIQKVKLAKLLMLKNNELAGVIKHKDNIYFLPIINDFSYSAYNECIIPRYKVEKDVFRIPKSYSLPYIKGVEYEIVNIESIYTGYNDFTDAPDLY